MGGGLGGGGFTELLTDTNRLQGNELTLNQRASYTATKAALIVRLLFLTILSNYSTTRRGGGVRGY